MKPPIPVNKLWSCRNAVACADVQIAKNNQKYLLPCKSGKKNATKAGEKEYAKAFAIACARLHKSTTGGKNADLAPKNANQAPKNADQAPNNADLATKDADEAFEECFGRCPDTFDLR